MADFTVDEIAILKKAALLQDKYDEREVLQKGKADAILAIKQKSSSDIDAINDQYNPQIKAIDDAIASVKNA